MSISAALSAARSGLQVTGARAEMVATNVANANTPGYVRRSVTLAENLLAGQTDGVRLAGVSRAQNPALTEARRDLSSDLAQSNALASSWRSIDARLGGEAGSSALFEAYGRFETALADLVVTPESTIGQRGALNAARAIAAEFKSLSLMAETMRAEADQQIAVGVETVNAALKRVETLNGEISGADPNSNKAAALADERDRALDTIAEHLPIQALARPNGVVDVLTREGVYLLAGKAKSLAFTPARAFGAEHTLANGALSGLSVDGVELTPGAASHGAVSSGVFGALFTVRDQIADTVLSDLDSLASDLVSRFSDDAVDPTKPAGAPGLFLDPQIGGGPGLAGRLSVNSLVDPDAGGDLWRLRDGLGAASEGPPGNPAILRNLADAMSAGRTATVAGLETTRSATGFVALMASAAGQARVQSDSVLASAAAQLAIAEQAEIGASGVDTDAEMQELLLIEQAYAANARVIQTASELLDRLMEI